MRQRTSLLYRDHHSHVCGTGNAVAVVCSHANYPHQTASAADIRGKAELHMEGLTEQTTNALKPQAKLKLLRRNK